MPSLRPALRLAALTTVMLAAPRLSAQDGRTIRGTVSSADGVPVAGAQVTTETAMLRTDDAGRFTLRLPGCDSVVVAVRRLGFRPARLVLDPCAPTTADTLRVVLERAAVVLATDSVTAELSGVEGLVTNDQGIPVAGAEVTVYHLGRAERGRTTQTDFEGRYVLLDLEPGRALLRVRHPRLRMAMRGVLLERARVKDIGISLPELASDTRDLRSATGHDGFADAAFFDMSRRQQARPTSSAFATSDELRATGEPMLVCAIGKVPGLIGQVMRGVPPRSTFRRGAWPLRFVGGCLDGDICTIVIDPGRTVTNQELGALRTDEVTYVELYGGEFQLPTINTLGCRAPMMVVWARTRDGW